MQKSDKSIDCRQENSAMTTGGDDSNRETVIPEVSCRESILFFVSNAFHYVAHSDAYMDVGHLGYAFSI